MLAPWEEQEAFEYYQREEAREWVAMQEAFKDILQQIPAAEGLDEWHRMGTIEEYFSAIRPNPQYS